MILFGLLRQGYSQFTYTYSLPSYTYSQFPLLFWFYADLSQHHCPPSKMMFWKVPYLTGTTSLHFYLPTFRNHNIGSHHVGLQCIRMY